MCFHWCREELISHYKQLSDAADVRTAKAQWRVRRRQLHKRRVDLLQPESRWTSSADGYATEVLIVALLQQVPPPLQ